MLWPCSQTHLQCKQALHQHDAALHQAALPWRLHRGLLPSSRAPACAGPCNRLMLLLLMAMAMTCVSNIPEPVSCAAAAHVSGMPDIRYTRPHRLEFSSRCPSGEPVMSLLAACLQMSCSSTSFGAAQSGRQTSTMPSRCRRQQQALWQRGACALPTPTPRPPASCH